MLRLVFDPLRELLRSRRDAELEHDNELPQTRFFLRYLRSVVLEYTRALTLPRPGQPAGVVHPELQALIIELCTMPPAPDFYSLHQMLMYRVVHDSTPVALRLLQLAAGYPPAFQAALDMLGRLKHYDMVVDIYWRHRMPERAVRLAVAHNVTRITAAQLLDQAAAIDDEEKEAAAARKFRTFLDEDDVEPPLELSRLRAAPGRSVFAQVFAMLQPRMRIVDDLSGDLSATSPLAPGAASPSAVLPMAALSPARGGSTTARSRSVGGASSTGMTMTTTNTRFASPGTSVGESVSSTTNPAVGVRRNGGAGGGGRDSPESTGAVFTIAATQYERFAERFAAAQQQATSLSF